MPRRVLIADDNERIRHLVQSQIEALEDVEICATVANGIQAVEAAILFRPDLLILDVLMPDLNGIQVASVLKKNLPDAKIILFTLLSDTLSPQTIASLAARLVSKADGLLALRFAVQELLDSKAQQDYANFFNGDKTAENRPPRSGYYLGYLALKQLGTTRSLRELAHLNQQQARPALESALAALAHC